MHEHELQFHIQCKAGDVGRYVLLPAIRAAARSLPPISTTR